MSGKILTRDDLGSRLDWDLQNGEAARGVLDHDQALRELVRQAIDMLECQDNIVIKDEAGNHRYEMCFVCESENYDLHDDIRHDITCPRANWLARAKAALP